MMFLQIIVTVWLKDCLMGKKLTLYVVCFGINYADDTVVTTF